MAVAEVYSALRAQSRLSILLAMGFSTAQTRLVVHNAGSALPDIESLVAVASTVRASTIACLNFDTEFRSRREVAHWAERTSALLAEERMHLLTFNTDLALVIGRPCDLSPGIHRIASRMWLVARVWVPKIPAARAHFGFVGSGITSRGGFTGSLWTDELLKPADLDQPRSCRTVVTDVHADHLAACPAQRPRVRDALAVHRSLGPEVVQRLSPSMVWAPGPSSTPVPRHLASVRTVPPGSTSVAGPSVSDRPVSEDVDTGSDQA